MKLPIILLLIAIVIVILISIFIYYNSNKTKTGKNLPDEGDYVEVDDDDDDIGNVVVDNGKKKNDEDDGGIQWTEDEADEATDLLLKMKELKKRQEEQRRKELEEQRRKELEEGLEEEEEEEEVVDSDEEEEEEEEVVVDSDEDEEVVVDSDEEEEEVVEPEVIPEPEPEVIPEPTPEAEQTDKYTGTYSGKFTYPGLTMRVKFTYKNKNNIRLDQISFDPGMAFTDGKDLLLSCPDKTVRIDGSDMLAGPCIDTITTPGHINHVDIGYIKLNFTSTKIKSVDVKAKVSIKKPFGGTINKDEVFTVDLTRS